jgi:ABC-type lipoprotein release transport system permease subunit
VGIPLHAIDLPAFVVVSVLLLAAATLAAGAPAVRAGSLDPGDVLRH